MIFVSDIHKPDDHFVGLLLCQNCGDVILQKRLFQYPPKIDLFLHTTCTKIPSSFQDIFYIFKAISRGKSVDRISSEIILQVFSDLGVVGKIRRHDFPVFVKKLGAKVGWCVGKCGE